MIINGHDYDREIERAKGRLYAKIYGIKSAGEMFKSKPNLLITSEGTGLDSHVYCNGVELKNVTSVQINKILPGEFVTATIEVVMPHLHVWADQE